MNETDDESIDFLVLGGTGLAGSSIVKELKSRNKKFRFASRCGKDIKVDATAYEPLSELIKVLKPKNVINCVAEINISFCESNFVETWRKNVEVVVNLSYMAQCFDFKLVQISTDHYFTGDTKEKHNEQFPVVLLNAYAKQKYCAEIAASQATKNLILRTSFTGNSSYSNGRETLWSWVRNALDTGNEVTLFSDAFTSTLDNISFAKCVVDLIDTGASGIFNVASSDVFSKEEFFLEVAKQLGINYINAQSGSVVNLATARANNLGLCTKKIEKSLGYSMPGLEDVVERLIQNHINS